MPHNIDFHASTGALGGGALTLIYPGEQVVLRFKATRPGVFVYHCAPPGMVPSCAEGGVLVQLGSSDTGGATSRSVPGTSGRWSVWALSAGAARVGFERIRRAPGAERFPETNANRATPSISG